MEDLNLFFPDPEMANVVAELFPEICSNEKAEETYAKEMDPHFLPLSSFSDNLNQENMEISEAYIETNNMYAGPWSPDCFEIHQGIINDESGLGNEDNILISQEVMAEKNQLFETKHLFSDELSFGPLAEALPKHVLQPNSMKGGKEDEAMCGRDLQPSSQGLSNNWKGKEKVYDPLQPMLEEIMQEERQKQMRAAEISNALIHPLPKGSNEDEAMYGRALQPPSLGFSHNRKGKEKMYDPLQPIRIEYLLEEMMQLERKMRMRAAEISHGFIHPTPKFVPEGSTTSPNFLEPSYSIPVWQGSSVGNDMNEFMTNNLMQLSAKPFQTNAPNAFQVLAAEVGGGGLEMTIAAEEGITNNSNRRKRNKNNGVYMEIESSMPPGWRVFGKARTFGLFKGYVDKKYFPPGVTRKPFRSRREAEQFIQEQRELEEAAGGVIQ